jgi:tetratricopeptide (TPR) repeat protein
MQRKIVVAVSLVFLTVLLAYANFFSTGLHYDEYAMVRDNPAIRTLSNIPRFFTDTSTTSASPAEYAYQPVVTASFAIDYVLGHGVSPFVLHLSVFLFYLAGLACLAWFFNSVYERAISHPWNPYLAAMTAALVGLHPAAAELLNPINKRGELFATFGVIAGMALYAGLPGIRRYFLYLVPPFLAVLANPAGLIFGPMLLLYIILIEPPRSEEEALLTEEQIRTRDETQALAAAVEGPKPSGSKRVRIRRRKHPFRRYVATQLKRFMPALLFTAAAEAFHSRVTPFETSGETAIRYWFTQPWVALRYFRSFFAPFYFSPASDLGPFPAYDVHAVFGLAFVLAVIAAALIFAVSRPWRPAVFGLWWFLVGLLPGAMLSQAYVEADSRMLLPFVGLAMTLAWIPRMLLPSGEPLRRLEAIVASFLLLFLGYQTHVRNQVWSTDESLWRDAIGKSPASVHAVENYGLALADAGRTQEGYEYLLRARRLAPKSPELEAYLGTVSAMLNRVEEAEQHFRRALSLGATVPVTHLEYGKFLEKHGDRQKAIDSYSWAASLALTDLRPRYGMMRLYVQSADWNNLRTSLEDARPLWRDDPAFAKYAEVLRNHPDTIKGAELLVQNSPTPENYMILSESYCLGGEFKKCLDSANKAIELRPNYPQAYNAIGAAYVSMGRVDEAIQAAMKALQIDPDYKAARTNLNVWQQQKLLAGNEIMRK